MHIYFLKNNVKTKKTIIAGVCTMSWLVYTLIINTGIKARLCRKQIRVLNAWQKNTIQKNVFPFLRKQNKNAKMYCAKSCWKIEDCSKEAIDCNVINSKWWFQLWVRRYLYLFLCCPLQCSIQNTLFYLFPVFLYLFLSFRLIIFAIYRKHCYSNHNTFELPSYASKATHIVFLLF